MALKIRLLFVESAANLCRCAALWCVGEDANTYLAMVKFLTRGESSGSILSICDSLPICQTCLDGTGNVEWINMPDCNGIDGMNDGVSCIFCNAVYAVHTGPSKLRRICSRLTHALIFESEESIFTPV